MSGNEVPSGGGGRGAKGRGSGNSPRGRGRGGYNMGYQQQPYYGSYGTPPAPGTAPIAMPTAGYGRGGQGSVALSSSPTTGLGSRGPGPERTRSAPPTTHQDPNADQMYYSKHNMRGGGYYPPNVYGGNPYNNYYMQTGGMTQPGLNPYAPQANAMSTSPNTQRSNPAPAKKKSCAIVIRDPKTLEVVVPAAKADAPAANGGGDNNKAPAANGTATDAATTVAATTIANAIKPEDSTGPSRPAPSPAKTGGSDDKIDKKREVKGLREDFAKHAEEVSTGTEWVTPDDSKTPTDTTPTTAASSSGSGSGTAKGDSAFASADPKATEAAAESTATKPTPSSGGAAPAKAVEPAQAPTAGKSASGSKKGKADSPSAPPGIAAAAPPVYKDGQWNPADQEGARVYDRSFLMQFQPLCTEKPKGLQNVEDFMFSGNDRKGGGGGGGGRGRSSGGRNKSGQIDPGASIGKGGYSNNLKYPNNNNNNNRSGGRNNNRSGGRRSRGRNDGRGRGRGGGGPTIDLKDVKPLELSDSRWKPKRAQGADDGEEEHELEVKLRKIKSLLNRLSVEKFDQIAQQIAGFGLDDIQIVRGTIALLFEKAVDEIPFAEMYANLARYLSEQTPELVEDGKRITFRQLTVNNCQSRFENGFVLTEAQLAEVTEDDKDYIEERMRKRGIGNMVFVGELYHKGLIGLNVINAISQLTLKDMEDVDKIEMGLTLVAKVGHRLAQEDASSLAAVMSRLRVVASAPNLPSRIRFKAEEVIEMSDKGWAKRFKEVKPMTLDEVRRQAEADERAAEREKAALRQKSSRNRHGRRGGRGGGRNGNNYNNSSNNRYGSNNTGVRNNSRGGANDWKEAGAGQRSRDTKSSKARTSSIHGETTRLGPGGSGGSLANGASGWKNSPKAANSPVGIDRLDRGRPQRPKVATNLFASLLADDDDEVAPSSPESATAAAPAGLDESEEEELPELTTEQVTKMERNIKGFVEEYAMNSDYDEAKLCLSELEADGYGATVVQLAVSSVFEAKEKYALACAELFGKFLADGLISGDDVSDGFESALGETYIDICVDAPLATKWVAVMLASCLVTGELDYAFLPDILDDLVDVNMAVPLLLKTLDLLKEKNVDVVSKLAEGGINVVNLYPSDRRNPSNVHRQLQMKGYEHFFPLLAVEGILSDMFAKGDAADTITQTLQSLEEKVTTSPEFGKMLIRTFLTHVANNTFLRERGTVVDNEEGLAIETQLLAAFNPVLRFFFHEKLDVQVEVIDEIVHWFLQARRSTPEGAEFPPGILSRWMMALYDVEIIIEEAYEGYYEMFEERFDPEASDDHEIIAGELQKWMEALQQASSEEDSGDEGDQ